MFQLDYTNVNRSGAHCPVCDAVAKSHGTDHMDGYHLLEEWLVCGECDYQYNYAYGYYQGQVNGKEFGWSYANTENDIAAQIAFDAEVAKGKMSDEAKRTAD